MHATPEKWALLSVSDKTGLAKFAQHLVTAGYQLLASGGTSKTLKAAGLAVTEVSDFTGFPEIFDGRVKTLHPKIYAGILARRDHQADLDTLDSEQLVRIDIVVVNLYPFADTMAKPDCTMTQAIENIDIGGPTLIRAAAKNHQHVNVVIDPNDYQRVADALANNDGQTKLPLRQELARKAFAHTASYDQCITNYLSPAINSTLPTNITLSLNQHHSLRYGENPHQAAAVYAPSDLAVTAPNGTLSHANICQGKALSYNNFVDAEAAWQCVQACDPDQTACVIVKHANPCGVAIAADTTSAYLRANQTDSTSAFGGIIAFNQAIDADTAQTIIDKQFLEILMAPSFTDAALEALSSKPNVRVLAMGAGKPNLDHQFRPLSGGHWLVQQTDQHIITLDDLTCCTDRQPTDQQLANCLFAWRVGQYVKSNAIVLAKDQATIGIGAGQMSRIDSTELALSKAKRAELDVTGCVLSSDGFFPFADSIQLANEAGISAIIQPGGAIRDGEVTAAANEAGIAMILTGVRHFWH